MDNPANGMSSPLMAARALGQFEVSIATSLAFEGAFDILEETPKRYPTPPIMHYDQVWINLRTLFRNIHGSLEKEAEKNMLSVDYQTAMQTEMAVIDGILADRTGGKVKPVFYVCSYQNLTRKFPKAIFKEAKTEKQQFYAAMENDSLELLFNTPSNIQHDVRSFDTDLKCDGRVKALIITHYPIDLLSRYQFAQLDLLESHTGIIKKPPQWNTKLKNGKELVRIPFDKMTIQMFGDSGDLFAPYPIQHRRLMLEMAEKYKWTSTTTKDRVLLSAKGFQNFQLEILIKQMY